MSYYVVKKYEPGEVFAAIVTALVIAVFILVLTIYIGLIFLGIIGIIAGVVGLIYALVLYIRAFVTCLKNNGRTPRGLKEFYLIWNKNIVDASKEAFMENLRHADNLYNRQKIYRFRNPAKFFMLFLSLFIILIGIIFIIFIGLVQYLLMIAIIFAIAFIFALMVMVSMVISVFISFGFGMKYLHQNMMKNNLFSTLKISTYSYFKNMGSEINDYWLSFKESVNGLTSDMKSHAKGQWNNVSNYAFYSPVKYYYIASPISLYFNIGIVAILFALFAAITFIILLIIKIICCIITAIMRH